MKDPKIIALRERIGKEVTGNTEFISSDYVKLDPSTQIAITNTMKAEIASNPEEYSPEQVKVANSPEIGDIEEFTFGDAVSSAVQGAGEGASKFGLNLGSGIQTALTLGALASGAFAVVKLVELLNKKK